MFGGKTHRNKQTLITVHTNTPSSAPNDLSHTDTAPVPPVNLENCFGRAWPLKHRKLQRLQGPPDFSIFFRWGDRRVQPLSGDGIIVVDS